jgi:hypothetical protein
MAREGTLVPSPATKPLPNEWAERVAGEIFHGVSQEQVGVSHDGAPRQNRCVPSFVEACGAPHSHS